LYLIAGWLQRFFKIPVDLVFNKVSLLRLLFASLEVVRKVT